MDSNPPSPPPAVAAAKPLEQRLATHSIIPVFKLGFVTSGSGEIDSECNESGTPVGSCSGSSPGIDYDDEASFVLGADLLFRVSPSLRLGVGSLVVPDPKYKLTYTGQLSGFTQEIESGLEASLFGVVEGAFPVGPSVGCAVSWVSPRSSWATTMAT